MSCPSLPFLSAVFVPNVLARRTSLSPGCGKHIYVLFWFFPFHFAVIHHSTATKAENKVPIRLEAMGPFVGKVTPCGHSRELQLQLKKKKENPPNTKGGPADVLHNTTCSHQRPSLQLSARFNWENEPSAEQEHDTHTTQQTSKDTCNRYLNYFTSMRSVVGCSGPVILPMLGEWLNVRVCVTVRVSLCVFLTAKRHRGHWQIAGECSIAGCCVLLSLGSSVTGQG